MLPEAIRWVEEVLRATAGSGNSDCFITEGELMKHLCPRGCKKHLPMIYSALRDKHGDLKIEMIAKYSEHPQTPGIRVQWGAK